MKFSFCHSNVKLKFVKTKGMFVGMWIEIEEIGVDSPILKDIKDEWFFQING